MSLPLLPDRHRAERTVIGQNSASAPSVLRAEDLVVEIAQGGEHVRVIDGVSFELGRGEVLGLVGESGCGKTLTVRSIVGLLPNAVRVAGGRVLFGDEDLTVADESRMRQVRGGAIGFIFQDAAAFLNPTMSIGRQISEAARIHLGMSRKQAIERTVDLLGHVGLPAPRRRLNEFPHQFSGGMRQRVMIATALAGDPSVVLADEPTTALDVTVQAQILELLQSLSEEFGLSVLLITHDLGIAARSCQRLCVMYSGRIVESGDVDDVFENPQMPYTMGLLASVPRLDSQPGSYLQAIAGHPPRLTDRLGGCRFAPRCAFRRDVCDEAEPDLTSRGVSHRARCLGTEDGAWIRTVQ